MLTVRLMSGISQPIPAHLVLTNSRQALSHHSEGTDFWQECDSIQYYFSFTQFSSLTWHAPSHHEYCPHWAFQCESPWSLTCQKILPSPLPKRLWDNEQFIQQYILTNKVSSVLPQHKDLYFHLGVTVSQQRKNEAEHFVNVPGSKVSRAVDCLVSKTLTKCPPSSSALYSAGRYLVCHRRWSIP